MVDTVECSGKRGDLVRAEAAQDSQLLEGGEARSPGLWQGHILGLVAVKDGLEGACLVCKPCGKALHKQ